MQDVWPDGRDSGQRAVGMGRTGDKTGLVADGNHVFSVKKGGVAMKTM
jgi:hypothetical protein